MKTKKDTTDSKLKYIIGKINDLENEVYNTSIVSFVKGFEDVIIPSKATVGSAGFDLRAYLYDEETGENLEKIAIQSNQRVKIGTGLRFSIPHGYEIQIRPRSGLAYNNGITLINCIGTIDSDFRGEVCVLIINLSDKIQYIHHNDRICQAILSSVKNIEFNEVDELDETKRGSGSMGSTGKN